MNKSVRLLQTVGGFVLVSSERVHCQQPCSCPPVHYKDLEQHPITKTSAKETSIYHTNRVTNTPLLLSEDLLNDI